MENNYKAAPDVYNDINDFILEYSSDYNDHFETNRGLDFIYKEKLYHMARYMAETVEERRQFSLILNKNIDDYQYEILIYEKLKSPFYLGNNITIIGFYKDIFDLVENAKIEDKLFKDLLLNHELTITGKD